MLQALPAPDLSARRPPAILDVLRAMAAFLRPRPLTTVSQWADRHRVLSSKASAEAGQWRTDRTPYLREILDHLSASARTQRVVLCFAAQVGKTEVGLNWIGYVMHHAPAPMLVVLPSLEIRKRWVLQRLAPMLRESTVLREMFANRKRDAANSEDVKDYPGGLLVLSGANSPASLASMPIKYVVCDEVDSYDTELGDEGDPLKLITQRQSNFPRRKLLLVSTPKKPKGESLIENAYLDSDQRQYHVPCPHCDTLQPLLWRHPDGSHGLKRNDATGEVYYGCRACGERIQEHHKPAMLAAGRWIARRPDHPTRGYHLTALYAPIGLGLSWRELWDEWLDAQTDTSKLKSFIQTKLAETWEAKKEGVDATRLVARLEVYPEHMPRRLRAVGIDVQKGRIEMSVWDFGPGEECWAIDHIIVEGDEAATETWDALYAEIDAIRPDCGAIDSGYAATQVYAFAARLRWLLVTKGIEGTDKTFVEDPESRRKRLRKRRKKGHAPLLVGNVAAMMLITQRLNLPAPDPGQPMPGYLHLPKGDPAFDDEYLRQLASSAYVEEKRQKKTVYVWKEKATHPRNEAFDCWKLALFAARLTGKPMQARHDTEPDATATAPPMPTPTPTNARPGLPRRVAGLSRR